MDAWWLAQKGRISVPPERWASFGRLYFYLSKIALFWLGANQSVARPELLRRPSRQIPMEWCCTHGTLQLPLRPDFAELYFCALGQTKAGNQRISACISYGAGASPSKLRTNRSPCTHGAARLGLACCSGGSPNPTPRVLPAPQIQPQQTLR